MAWTTPPKKHGELITAAVWNDAIREATHAFQTFGEAFLRANQPDGEPSAPVVEHPSPRPKRAFALDGLA